jgi:uncharacterized protein
VAVSIDGPAPDNTARADRGGRDSTARTLRGIDLLRRHKIPFGAIAVVADPTPARAVALYDWFAGLGATSLGVNIEERKGVHRDVSDTGAQVAELWAALAQCWAADRRMPIREFAHAFGYVRDMLAGRSAARADRPLNPMPMITWDGQVVPVSLPTRAAEVPWVAEALAGVAAGRATCDHFAYCRGGQAANKYFESGRLDGIETNYCRNSKIALMKRLIQHVDNAHA